MTLEKIAAARKLLEANTPPKGVATVMSVSVATLYRYLPGPNEGCMGLIRAHEDLLTAIAEEVERLPLSVWRAAFTSDSDSDSESDSREVSQEMEQMEVHAAAGQRPVV